ncbi:maleylpyruvate isomerase N-terminal domain-containing protein [Nocardia sp. NBC_00508]|uniref:maleylpyruvate isomerase N-terminal domain-containing protein n=1 Tax=Nocardia sp. NBC_00508 TaxID=2975992 RepID=UPI002E80E9F5|nr:maleylpyruvate isomerase N-terminal domain-containing protein [Nocardia sp. NBC_00508]WUD68421.1 maleylpyruvate isomerase N-terminal domain-containing protein [Nocardia sp. NBC_00508]
MIETLDRTAQIDLLSQQWDAIDALVAPLDEHRWRTPSPLPGWTVFDVVAHVIGTESWLLGDRPPAHDPTRVKTDVRTLPYVRNETAVLNEIWVDRLRPLSGARLLGLYRDVIDRRRAALAAMGDAEWEKETVSPIGQISYGRFMRVRLFDCWMHELDIADALGARVEEGGPRGELAFAEFVLGVPRVVAKKGEAPEGARIAFALTGPLARTLRIQVAGRANYVDAFEEPATVEIDMDSQLFVRLGGGRTKAEEHLDEITIHGNTDLGQRLVSHLAFTI